jgi:hypothetical protein
MWSRKTVDQSSAAGFSFLWLSAAFKLLSEPTTVDSEFYFKKFTTFSVPLTSCKKPSLLYRSIRISNDQFWYLENYAYMLVEKVIFNVLVHEEPHLILIKSLQFQKTIQ